MVVKVKGRGRCEAAPVPPSVVLKCELWGLGVVVVVAAAF